MQIADELRPNQLVITFLSKLCNVIPSWRVVPTSQDIIDVAFKIPEVREQVYMRIARKPQQVRL